MASRLSHDCALIMVFSWVICWFMDMSHESDDVVTFIISADPPSTVLMSLTEDPEKIDDSFGR